jgi:hypothetical protein
MNKARIRQEYTVSGSFLLDALYSVLIGLLNGPGHFDGGTCDGALRAIAKKYEIDDVEV